MDLDPRLLRYFIAVAEERHFSRAATRLHISQPPLSYAIRQLEDNVGARLLARTSRHVELTDAGHVLYREALTLLRQAEEVRTLVQRVDAGLRGRLRIGFVGSMLYRGLPVLLNAMRAELPDVEHVLTELNSHEQIEAVRRGEQDLGFIHANPVPARPHPAITKPCCRCAWRPASCRWSATKCGIGLAWRRWCRRGWACRSCRPACRAAGWPARASLRSNTRRARSAR